MAVSFYLARPGLEPGLADFARAVELCDNCGRSLRALSDVLADAVPLVAESNDNDAISALEWYVLNLREDSGLNVRFEAAGVSSNGMGPSVRTIICAAVQRWAETAIHQAASSHATRILLTQAPPQLDLQFLSALAGDPCIDAVLSSSLIRASVLAIGGSVESTSGPNGHAARLIMANARL